MTPQYLLVLPLLTALAVCVNARAIGAYCGVLANPDNHRKTHRLPTPQVGGIAILSGFVVWLGEMLFLSGTAPDRDLLAILFSASGIGLVGFVDDQHEISPLLRILLLLVFVGIAFAFSPDFVAGELHWYSFGAVRIDMGVYLPLMALTTVGLVNSVNMADGQNGLVGSMFVVWSVCLAIVTDGNLQAAAVALAALSAVFLAFNLRGKIFLGDCGSYGITVAIGLLVTLAHAAGRVALETVIVWFFIPVVDCLRVMVTRKLQGRPFFEGGRDHFHHRLIDSLGMRRSAAAYIASIGCSSLIATLVPRLSLVVLCAMCAFYFSLARLSEGNVAQKDRSGPADDTASDKVVSMRRER